MKGQLSTEMLVVVGLVLLIFIPLLTLVYFKAAESNEKLASYQAELAVFRVAYLANAVGSLGTNSSIFTDVYLPEGTLLFETQPSGQGGELVLNRESSGRSTEIAEVIIYPLASPGPIIVEPLPEGRWIRLKVSSIIEGERVNVMIEQAG